MFKNLRKKIAEEVGQPAARLPVQQLSQLISGDNRDGAGLDSSAFTLDDDAESLAAEPRGAAASLTAATTAGARLRQNSTASSTVSESPYHPAARRAAPHMELESGSEVSSLVGLGAVSKEQMLQSYQRMRAKYNKYRGRYTDLARAFHALENDNEKLRATQRETEERAQRRAAELREQCALEQQAKAHLEEALRTDLEERDELVKLLNMKVQLLKEGRTEEEPAPSQNGSDQAPTPASPPAPSAEADQLRDKVKHLEELLTKCRENIKLNKSRTATLVAEKTQLQTLLTEEKRQLDATQEAHKSELERLEAIVGELRRTMASTQHQAQENAMSTAEQKAQMHQELEQKETQVKRLQDETESKRKSLEQLQTRVAALETETTQLRDTHKRQLEELERLSEEEKAGLVQELSRAKQEALRVLEQELESRLAEEWGRRLHLREEELRAEIREKESQLELAAEEQQLAASAAAAGGHQTAQRAELIDTIDGLRTDQMALESRLQGCQQAQAQAEARLEQAQVQMEEARKEAEARIEEARKKVEARMEEARKEAEAQVEEARKEVEARVEGARSSALEEARKEAEARVEEARKEAEAQVEEARKGVETRLEEARVGEARSSALEEARKEAEARMEEARKEAEARVQEARKEADARVEELDRQRQAAVEELDRQRQAAVELSLQTSSQENSARLESQAQADELQRRLTSLSEEQAATLAELEAERGRGAADRQERQQLQLRTEKLSGVVRSLEESLRELTEQCGRDAEVRAAAAAATAATPAAPAGSQLDELTTLLDDNAARLAGVTEEVGALRLAKQQLEAEALRTARTDLDDALRTARSELESTVSDISDFDEVSEGYRTEAERQRADELHESNERLAARLFQMEKIALRVELAENENENLKSELAYERERGKKQRDRVKQLKSLHEVTKDEVSGMQADFSLVHDEMGKIRATLTARLERVQEQNRSLELLQSKLDQAMREKSALKEQLESGIERKEREQAQMLQALDKLGNEIETYKTEWDAVDGVDTSSPEGSEAGEDQVVALRQEVGGLQKVSETYRLQMAGLQAEVEEAARQRQLLELEKKCLQDRLQQQLRDKEDVSLKMDALCSDTNSVLVQLREENGQLRARAEAEQARSAQLAAQLAEVERDHKQVSRQIEDAGLEKDTLATRIALFKTQLKEQAELIDCYKYEVGTLKQNYDNLDSEVKRQEELATSLRAINEEIDRKLSAEKELKKNFEDKLSQKLTEMAQLQASHDALRGKNACLEEQLASASVESEVPPLVKVLRGEKEALSSQLEGCEERWRAASAELLLQQTRLHESERQNADCQRQVESVTQLKEVLETRCSEAEQEAAALKKKLEEAHVEMIHLKALQSASEDRVEKLTQDVLNQASGLALQDEVIVEKGRELTELTVKSLDQAAENAGVRGSPPLQGVQLERSRLNAEFEALQLVYENTSMTLEASSERLKRAEDDRAHLRRVVDNQRDELAGKSEEFEERLQEYLREITNKNEEITVFLTELKQNQDEMDDAKASVGQLQDIIRTKESTLRTLSAELATAKSRAQTQNERFLAREAELTRKLQEEKEMFISQLTEVRETMRSSIGTMQAKIQQLNELLKSQDLKHHVELSRVRCEYEQQLDELQQALAGVRSQCELAIDELISSHRSQLDELTHQRSERALAEEHREELAALVRSQSYRADSTPEREECLEKSTRSGDWRRRPPRCTRELAAPRRPDGQRQAQLADLQDAADQLQTRLVEAERGASLLRAKADVQAEREKDGARGEAEALRTARTDLDDALRTARSELESTVSDISDFDEVSEGYRTEAERQRADELHESNERLAARLFQMEKIALRVELAENENENLKSELAYERERGKKQRDRVKQLKSLHEVTKDEVSGMQADFSLVHDEMGKIRATLTARLERVQEQNRSLELLQSKLDQAMREKSALKEQLESGIERKEREQAQMLQALDKLGNEIETYKTEWDAVDGVDTSSPEGSEAGEDQVVALRQEVGGLQKVSETYRLQMAGLQAEVEEAARQRQLLELEKKCLQDRLQQQLRDKEDVSLKMDALCSDTNSVLVQLREENGQLRARAEAEQARSAQLAAQLAEVERDHKQVSRQIEDAGLEKDTLATRIALFKTQLKEQAELIDCYKYEVGTLKQNYDNLDSEVKRQEELATSLRAINEEIDRKLSAEKELKKNFEDKLSQKLTEMAQLQTRLHESERQNADCQRQVESVTQLKEVLETRCSEAEQEAAALKKKLEEAHLERSRLNAEFEALQLVYENTSMTLEASSERLKRAEDDRAHLRRVSEEFEERLQEYLREITNKNEEITVFLTELKQNQDEMDDAKASVGQLQDIIRTKESTLRTLSAELATAKSRAQTQNERFLAREAELTRKLQEEKEMFHQPAKIQQLNELLKSQDLKHHVELSRVRCEYEQQLDELQQA
ncbi:A-kinase anchor protein 9-like [Pollicipes pollicipes]|uniref:A-kinase anchor protein 9-like n=1 Tax=Pollicipes pollicipes TaxID=41117 RepID=UPI0018859600|nr:A-kinase anchor protein 9-like [Pollicipes pollicipes]